MSRGGTKHIPMHLKKEKKKDNDVSLKCIEKWSRQHSHRPHLKHTARRLYFLFLQQYVDSAIMYIL